MPQLGEVFGIAASVPKYTYVDRAGLDRRFIYLSSQDRHLVIHGASKQGKTILRKKNIPEKDCIIVRCGAESTRNKIYLEILRQIGSQIPTEVSKSLSTGANLQISGSGQINLPLLGSFEGSTEGQGTLEKGSERTYTPAGIEPSSLVQRQD